MIRALSLALALALAQGALADPVATPKSNAIVDEARGLLTLEGRGSSLARPLILTINGEPEPLAIVAVTQTYVARLPERLGYGSYVLRVVDPERPGAIEELDFVIGVVGPTVRE